MDDTDRKICEILQAQGRASSAELAAAVGLSVSSANERVRRLVAQGVISQWQAVLDREAAGAALCAFVLIDMDFDGEAEAAAELTARPEVLELHHISGAHSYLMKLRLPDTAALQRFLQDVVKPLRAVRRTETMISLDTQKETAAVRILAPETRE
ncbi:Lrp/AsnC family transcriptional regulator [Tropicimonas marinistellae]|uniref:Lrp/AsnC family transcriptional regulator n=1 Tax=Tropicimonas marinistellae TaxID=1739787 RepID=UPI001372BA16|nr:Lrp/AsnC family transcriptional regulator [Tropicimonas marinistellae]